MCMEGCGVCMEGCGVVCMEGVVYMEGVVCYLFCVFLCLQFLYERWAHPRNIFKHQPLDHVRYVTLPPSGCHLHLGVTLIWGSPSSGVHPHLGSPSTEGHLHLGVTFITLIWGSPLSGGHLHLEEGFIATLCTTTAHSTTFKIIVSI